ncbi:MAG: class I SAM-dependent methyltransferase [Notoacmeibacter sp.]|nr:class I SAM-dependent methyltransferase [Notoacmeibacter sp.]
MSGDGLQDFEYGGQRFRVDVSKGKNRRPSDNEAFTIVKGKELIAFYEELASKIRPKTVLEVGVFQGGSYVLLDQIFKPEKMTAVEIDKAPVQPLQDYIAARQDRSVHWGTSQANEAALQKIVDNDLGGRLDLVVDDASHNYELTRKTFEVLFPRLSPGGSYVIEDWAWAHFPFWQNDDSPWREQPALTNLIFQIIVMIGSTSRIKSMDVHTHAVVITKHPEEKAVRHFNSAAMWDDLTMRGRPLPKI